MIAWIATPLSCIIRKYFVLFRIDNLVQILTVLISKIQIRNLFSPHRDMSQIVHVGKCLVGLIAFHIKFVFFKYKCANVFQFVYVKSLKLIFRSPNEFEFLSYFIDDLLSIFEAQCFLIESVPFGKTILAQTLIIVIMIAIMAILIIILTAGWWLLACLICRWWTTNCTAVISILLHFLQMTLKMFDNLNLN